VLHAVTVTQPPFLMAAAGVAVWVGPFVPLPLAVP
jgi:hypothetical protein